jgi:AMIN domain
MKYSSHSKHRTIQAVLCGLAVCACLCPARAADKTANVQSVQLLAEENGAAVEIVADQPVKPQITSLDSPQRLVIDLPYTTTSLRGKHIGSHIKDINVRVDQYTARPPVARIVVDLKAPVTYRVETVGDRILVHLRLEEHTPPTVPSLAKGEQPAAVPVSAATSGGVMMAGSRLAAGSSISAGSDTAILHLRRGGEIRVCAGTTISVTSSKGGDDLMLGVSTGALEAHYSLGTAADSVLTPDFRIVLAGPAEFDYAMSVNNHGDTCVRALPGNTAPIAVSELMGDGSYQLKANEQIVFRAGQLAVHDSDVPLDCGCAEPRPEALRASAPAATLPSDSLPTSVHVAQPGDKAVGDATSASSASPQASGALAQPSGSQEAAAPSPEGNANDVHVQVEAPLVFQGRAPHVETAPMSEVAKLQAQPPTGPKLPATVALPPPPPEEHHSFFGKIGHFFKSIFR